MTKTCKCGKQLMILNHHVTGKPAPIEAMPAENGNIVLTEDGQYRVLKQDESYHEDTIRYINHYANCPDASSWREEAKKKENQSK